MAIKTDPGCPSKIIAQYIESDQDFIQFQNSCQKCGTYKPMRSHHCSQCNKCVLKMDHHCPWINGCVGHYNHRYFLLMIFWLEIGSIFMSSIHFIYSDQIYMKSNFYDTAKAICYVFVIVLFFFNIWNWYTIFYKATGIKQFNYY